MSIKPTQTVDFLETFFWGLSTLALAYSARFSQIDLPQALRGSLLGGPEAASSEAEQPGIMAPQSEVGANDLASVWVGWRIEL